MSESDTNWAPALPRAVREQVERANALAREAGIANVPPDSSAAPDNGDVTTVVGDQPGVVLGTPEVPEGFRPAETPSGPPEGAGATEPATQAPAPPQLQADWEQRYNTLQGKYNSEVPELRGQVRSLQQMVEAMSARAAPMPGHLPASLPGNGAGNGAGNGQGNHRRAHTIPQSDVDNYGQELIEAAQRWAEHRVAPIIDEYEQRLAQVEGRSQQLVQAFGTSRVDQHLTADVPNWRTINDDPQFHDWLRQVDPFSGRTRQAMVEEAYAAGDAPRTAAFFNAYLREQTAVTPPVQGIRAGQTGNAAMGVGPAAPTPLEQLVVPGRGPVSPPQSSAAGAQGKRIWSPADITAFYDQKRRGLWLGRDAEVAAIEMDLFQAPLEGRIRG